MGTITMKHFQSLIERVPERYSGLRADLSTAFEIVNRMAAKAQEISADPHLSQQGKRARLESELGKTAREHLAQLKTRNRAALASIAAQRAALMPAVKDRDSVTGEMRRAELRAFLRQLSPADRTRILFAGDKDIIEATVDAPAALSGIDDALKQQAVDAYVEKTHAKTVADLAADAEARESVAAALTVAGREIEKLGESL